MPTEITKLVYSFEELIELEKQKKISSRAVDRAREWLQEGVTDHDWWDYVYDMWKRALDQIGFENAEINFSGFWSQGDGASFTASVDVPKLAKFMGTKIEASKCINPDKKGKEDFRPWIVHKVGGVAFDERYKLLARKSWCDKVSAKVTRSDSRYSHENTCDFEAEYDRLSENHDKIMFALYVEWQHSCERLRLDLCRAIYKSLEEEHESLNSDESLIGLCEANEYTFDDSGERDG